MQHFVSDDQMNIFRLPVSWQYLLSNQLGGTLNSTNFGKYDQLYVQSPSAQSLKSPALEMTPGSQCDASVLTTGAYCAIDIHNFARFNNNIIGQSSGAVTDAQFADLWTQLAAKYASSTKVIFRLMKEPHDLDIATWATTCQAAVTAIRNGGASSQMILLPGTNYASAGQFVSSGSAAALIQITNPDGSYDGLILDLHKYLDVDNSGTHGTCTTNNIADAFALAADFLRTNSRQALVSETGAGSDSSVSLPSPFPFPSISLDKSDGRPPKCFTDFCSQNTYLNQNSDVFLGYIAWAAGSFSTSYLLSLTSSKQNGKYVDNALASQCVIAPWLSVSSATFTSATTLSTAGEIFVTSAVSSGPATVAAEPNSSRGGTGSATTANPGISTTRTLVQTSISIATSSKNSTLQTSTKSVNGNGTSASSGSSVSTTSTPTNIVSTDGAEMRRFAGGLLAGSLLAAIML